MLIALSLGFVVVGTVVVLALRPHTWLGGLLHGEDAGARVARVMLPVAVLAPVLIGIVRYELQFDGVIGLDAAMAVYLVAMIVLVSGVVLALAVRLRRADVEMRALAAIVSTSADAMFHLRDGLITNVNPAAEQLYGYSAKQMIGRSPTMFAPPGAVAGIADALARAQQGEVVRTEGLRRRRDGSMVEVAATVSPIHDRSGRIVAASATVRNVSKRRQAERAAREAESRFRRLVESAPDAIVIVDEDGAIVLVNAQAELMFGYGRDELIGEPVELLMPDEDREQHEAIRAAYADDPYVRASGIGLVPAGRRRDGSTFPAEISLGALESDGRVLISSIIRDMTARTKAERALAEAQGRFQTAFEEAPIGMILLDLEGRFVSVNESFCRIVDRTPEQLIGKSVLSITHPDDVEVSRQGLRRMLASEPDATYTTEKRYIDASGRTIEVALHAAMLRGTDGAPINHLGQIQDITDRKRNEEHLVYLADHDALTGLFNRRAFSRELASHATLVERYGAAGSVMMIDLDQFKSVNDTLGHRAGDELIARTAGLFAGRLRATDVLARLGGDEFGVLLPKAGPTAALRAAESLLQALRDHPIRIDGVEQHITASIGIASFEDVAGVSGEDLLVSADRALYEAKDAGRDRVALASHTRLDVRRSYA